ncbi:mechanosensitive ion channel domain-containing protein [Branchiibius sp. NY16-3462-2]|uniref:mechanosensitive ion channel family protein n=1 Tax=Branchiibius sp. NY16-3462-2 TaxID=1807500 RepID=UPI0025BEFFE2|nr:mechanosensitive ion channel domain-containing protein [Branchiibius sp. NY16-3462-2]
MRVLDWLWRLDDNQVSGQPLHEWLLHTGLLIVIVIAFGVAVRWLIYRAINRGVRVMQNNQERRGGPSGQRIVRPADELETERRKQRALTVGALLKSVTTVVTAVVIALTVLAMLGVPLAPLVTTAGVGGVALGFGAQSLVKDYLSGITMIIEDQYGVGDVIDTGQAIGTVEEVTLRITRLRDAQGVVWYVRNGEILRLGNKSQGWANTRVDMPIRYDQDVEKALGVLRGVAADFAADETWNAVLVDQPDVVGVDSVAGGAVTLTTILSCLPGQQLPAAREFRTRVKVAMDNAGIVMATTPPATGATPPTGS